MDNPVPHGLTEQRQNFNQTKVDPPVEVVKEKEIVASGDENLGQVAAKIKDTSATLIELINDMARRGAWEASPLLSKIGTIIAYADKI
jgi:hypothetical protein